MAIRVPHILRVNDTFKELYGCRVSIVFASASTPISDDFSLLFQLSPPRDLWYATSKWIFRMVNWTYFFLNSFWQMEHVKTGPLMSGRLFGFSPKWMRRRCSSKLYLRMNAIEQSLHLNMRSLVCKRKWHRNEFRPNDRLQIGHGILSPIEMSHLCSISWKMHSASVNVLQIGNHNRLNQLKLDANDGEYALEIALFAAPICSSRVKVRRRHITPNRLLIGINRYVVWIFEHFNAHFIHKHIAAGSRRRAFIWRDFRRCHRSNIQMWYGFRIGGQIFNEGIGQCIISNHLFVATDFVANVSTQLLWKNEFLSAVVTSGINSINKWKKEKQKKCWNLRKTLFRMAFFQMLLQHHQVVQRFTANPTFSFQRLLLGLRTCCRYLMCNGNAMLFRRRQIVERQSARTT